jgi:hypothetical protein
MENKNLIRKCPICGKDIGYSCIYDLRKADKKNSYCKKCSINSGKLISGHKLNEIYSIKQNSLINLLDETPESFYWLGFIIADGSFYKDRFELTLSEKDVEHLKKFASFINFDKELYYRRGTKSYRIQFNNKESLQLVMGKYGISYNKTYNPIDFSILKNYNSKLLKAMLIGIIDGDGYIGKNTKTNKES